MICGLWLISDKGKDAAKIDLCPGLGQWRVQTLLEHEHIIGLHSFIVADDESVQEEDSLEIGAQSEPCPNEKDSSWLDSLGFIVYKFDVVKPEKPPARPRGRPRKLPLITNSNN